MSDRLALSNAIEDALVSIAGHGTVAVETSIVRAKAERIASTIVDLIHDNVATKAIINPPSRVSSRCSTRARSARTATISPLSRISAACTSSPACKLWEKVSAKGNRYLIGRMGGVRIMEVMTNTRPEDENDASHVLMFAEPPQYNQSQAAPAESSHPAPAPVHRRGRRNGKTQQIEDDPVPF